MVKWVSIPVLLAATACASGLTPRQELTWDAYKACQAEGPSTNLEGVSPDGGWRVIGREGEVFKVHRCMQAYWRRAAGDGRVPPLPPSLEVTKRAATSAVSVPLPIWAKGDEWAFRSESPTGNATFVWIVDREESVDGVPHYVIKSGRREIFYRKSDLATSQETVNRAVVVRNRPPRIRYVWPLAVGASWEQTYRQERPVDRQTSDLIDVTTVEAEETLTVPAGTFRTIKIVRRRKATGAIAYEE